MAALLFVFVGKTLGDEMKIGGTSNTNEGNEKAIQSYDEKRLADRPRCRCENIHRCLK